MSVHSVTSLMTTLNEALDAQPALQALTVRGEISNYKRSSAGHLYFTLKDDRSEIQCVMFAAAALYLRFPPSTGLQVVLQGGVELYGTRGQLQLRVRKMKPDGPGALRLKLEELRVKLTAEGLFDGERKRALSVLPVRVGIVTSREGSVLQDIVITLKRRNPAVLMVLSPAPVQGPEAPVRLVRALERVVAFGVDCVILARGGGSLEDLMAFNDEALVRAVAACPVPVVSAIGHQTDVTLCDLAADRRAPTPTAAAEMVAAELSELAHGLEVSTARLRRALERQLGTHRERLERLRSSPSLRFPERLTESRRAALDDLQTGLQRAVTLRARSERERLERLAVRPPSTALARAMLGDLEARLERSWTVRLRSEDERLGRLREAVLARHPRVLVARSRAEWRELEARLAPPLRLVAQRERALLAGLEPRLAPALLRVLRLRDERLAQLGERLRLSLERALAERRRSFGVLAGQLDAMSPLKVLERGYAFTTDASGAVVRSVQGRAVGDELSLHLSDGVLGVRVDALPE